MNVVKIWYQTQLAWFLYLFLPVELLYRFGIWVKRKFTHPQQISVPVIVVGNITLGGTGKTPLILWMIEHLEQQGLKIGVISRGYKSHPPQLPWLVNQKDAPTIVGDEPLLIAQTGVPIVISPNRVQAANFLLAHIKVDLIISDDGLQHYALGSNLELVLIDGMRNLGNQHCLPCGPLREPISRLKQVDAVIYNGKVHNHDHFRMILEPQSFINLQTLQSVALDYFLPLQQVHAIAGIGNPERFFATLRNLHLQPLEHPLPDHTFFTAEIFDFADDFPIIMTAKDAIKCSQFANDKMWYLQVKANPCAKFMAWFNNRLQEITSNEFKS